MGAKWASPKPAKLPAGRKQRRGNSPTSQPDYDADEFEFFKAVDRYKREKKRPFPTLSELLAVLKELGWKKEKKDDGA